MEKGKTIKQIADELHVSRQAVWQRVKRNTELSALLESRTQNINGTIFVDEVIEKHIKELYSQRFVVNHDPVNMVDDTVNIGVNTVNVVNCDPVNMVDDTVNMGVNTVNIENDTVNMLIKALQSDIETLQQQLTVKDNQINELTELLRVSQEQQKTLAAALANAQALHAGTIRERLENKSPETAPKRKKGFFSKIFGKK